MYVSETTPLGNSSYSHASQEEADKRAAQLDANDCTGCTDCADCTDCVDCLRCTRCTRCTDCTDCMDCTDCTGGAVLILFAFNVHLAGKWIDVVYYPPFAESIRAKCADIRQSLISHDGYDACITVTLARGQKVTVTEYEVQGYYPAAYGWETVTTETTRKAALAALASYRANERGVFRVVRRRVRIE